MSTARRRLKFFGPYSPKLGLLPLEDRAVPAVMLDTSFNTTGLFVRDVAGFSDTVNAVAVQADGGILLAGSTRSSGVTGDDFIITRLTPAGKLDTTFGPTSNGSIIIDLAAAAGTAGLNDAAKAIVIDSKGRILVAGSVERTGNASVFGIVRLDSAGKLDLSFNTDGITTVDFGGGEDFASAIAVSDARIIVAGISITPGVAPDHRFAVTALNEQGGPDGAFGGGIALYSTGKIDNTVAGVSIRANGSVVLAGTIATPDLATPTVQTTDFGLVQFTAAGLLDATFGIGGVAKSSFAGLLADRAFGAVFNPVDGSITVVGKTTLDPVSADFAVTQFNASGGVVSTFGTAGRLTARFAQSSQANAVAIDKTGALIVAGEVGTGADRDYAAIRIVNGQLDTAFGTSGKLIQDFPGANDFDGALAVAVQPDGRIVIAGQGGSASVDQTVARFTAPDGPVVVPPPTPRVPERIYSVGSDSGGSPLARLFNGKQVEVLSLTPFGKDFSGGIRTAAADVTGDGVADLIVASGPGRRGEVLVFDGATQKQIFQIVPFGEAFTRGIIVAAGDLNNDGKADLVITAERGGGARVRIFQSTGTSFTQRADFFALIGADNKADETFRGGSRGSVGDINGDGVGDLIFAAGAGGGPRIATFDGSKISLVGGPKLTGDFFALNELLRDGAYISAADFNGDGFADLIAGGGSGAPPQVVVFSGIDLLNNTKLTKLADYTIGDPNSRQGIRVAAKDVDGDGVADLLVGSAPTEGSKVSAYSGRLLSRGALPNAIFSVDAFGTFKGGVFIG